MASSATLTSLRTRIRTFLMDATKTVWADDANLDEALRLALDEMSRLAVEVKSGVYPNLKSGMVTPANAAREVSVAALAGLLDVREVWFPYTAAAPENPPNRAEFVEILDNGSKSIWLLGEQAGDGAKQARVFYRAMHMLSGLDGAAATSFPQSAEGLLVIGAGAHACLSRSIDLVETTTMAATSSPNLAELGIHLLSDFRSGLGVQPFVNDSSFSMQPLPAEWQYRPTIPPRR